jgi:ribosomal protein S18 acetylase RimI-like enzyme
MQGNPELANRFYEELVYGNRIIFVYSEDNEFLGEGALVFDTGDADYSIPGKRVYLSRLIVKSNHRNQGIGTALLNTLIEKARQLGFHEITVGVDKHNTRACYLYEKHGFDKVIFDGADEHGEFVKLLKTLN